MLMTPKDHTHPLAPRKRSRRVALLVAAFSVASSLACSVYDSSLLGRGALLSNGGDDTSSSADAGGGSASNPDADTSNGGSVAANGGSSDVAGGGGDSPLADAGESAGGAGGATGNTAGLGGMPANGGAKGGTGGTGSSGGTGNTGGSMATAGGSAKGGNGGSGGALHELAAGKKVTASSQEPANQATLGNDGSNTTRWCASDASFPQWWRVDLGANHLLAQVSILFEFSDRKYFYLVETSTDDAVYAQQVTASGTGVTQTIALPANVTARYVRITVTGATPVYANNTGTWASFWEFSLQGY